MCRYGLHDPVSKKLYKKSMSLLHNFNVEENLKVNIAGLFLKCNHKRDDHQVIEGSAPGYVSRAKLSQAYPRLFCVTLARIFSEFFLGPPVDQHMVGLVEDMFHGTDGAAFSTISESEID